MAKGESKSYDPASVEKRVFEFWERGGFFRAEPDERAETFCIVIPPPNVTGALHLGHALNNTLQDILVRRERMRGKNTFWLLGTDHAGIATQATVEKTIRKEEGKSRHDLGRDEMVRRIWEWKERFGGRIVEQMKLMGCSCDYSRERFTLDDICAKAVRHTFFKLFRDGLIYRGKRLVNWDTQLQTAVADDEVYHETVKGHFYHFKYPIVAQASSPVAGEPEFVHIATTRPETMLGDTAVAVHPKPDVALDKVEAELREKLASASEKDTPAIEASLEDVADRRKTLLPTLLKLRDMAKEGRKVMLPLVDREIPLICDDWAKPELGSGCVKITPAHDPNDYEVGQRHGLPMVNVLTEDGRVAQIVEPDGSVNANSSRYAQLRFATAGRDRVVEDMEAAGLVERIEDRMIDLGHSDRSKAPIEPFLSDQWFVRMGDLEPEHAAKVEGLRHHATGLAQLAIDAVKRGDFRFHPPRYEKTYIDWLSEKRDWCISRQLWWGHRIPVWVKSFPANTENDDLIRSLDDFGDTQSISPSSGNVKDNDGREILAYQVRRIHDRVFLHTCLPPADQGLGQLLQAGGYHQDPDVLDTWFSSALWPHSTLGWPDADASIRAATVWERTVLDAEQGQGRDGGERQPLPHGRGSDKTRGSDKAHGSDSLLEYYYPTNVLSTAREIITLWVARMVMTGLYNVGEVPFKDVVIHPVIQDGQGRKMSKSLGNGVDPVDIIDKYGADALRFTLADLATETQDIRMPVQTEKLPDGRTINVSPKFEKGRNFCNKLWQAATGFVMRNLDGYAPTELDPTALRLEDRWILSRMTACTEEVDQALGRYRFSDAIETLYHFMWDDFCSSYIEMTKSRLMGGAATSADDAEKPRSSERGYGDATSAGDATSSQTHDTEQPRSEERGSAQQVLVHVLDQLLRLLHPFVPFVTEAIWEDLNEAAPRRGISTLNAGEPALVAAAWPSVDAALRDETVESQMASLQAIVKAVREIRTTVNDHRGRAGRKTMRTMPLVVVRADEGTCRLVDQYRAFIQALAGCDSLEVGTGAEKPHGSMSSVIGAMRVYVPVADLIDLEDVRKAEEKKLSELRGAFQRAEKQLANESFVRRADPAVVEQARHRAADLSSQIESVEQHIADLT